MQCAVRPRETDKKLGPTEEGILFADLDFNMILANRTFVDACGHYTRPDLLWLEVDDREKKHSRPVQEKQDLLVEKKPVNGMPALEV